jgi:hypothetical protein
MAVGVAPSGLAGGNIGGSSSAAASKARKSRRLPPQQRLSYTPKHGYTTSVVRLLAGCEERLPLHASFVGTMRKKPPTSIMVEEGSGGQPLYLVKILHDEQGKSYLTDGWTRFLDDYDLKWGWSLILTHRTGSPILCVRVIDTSGCTRAYSPWPCSAGALGAPSLTTASSMEVQGLRGGVSFVVLALSVARTM